MNGKPLRFDFHGLYNGVVTMFDQGTESVWLQVGGRAIKGPMLGTKLKSGPLLDTTWGAWKKLHPDTFVMSPDTPYQKYYPQKGMYTFRGSPGGFPANYFRTSLTHGDGRMKPFDMILAVALPPPDPDPKAKPADNTRPKPEEPKALYRAYPVSALKETVGVVNDTLGTTPVGIFYVENPVASNASPLDPNNRREKRVTATAVSRLLDGKTLTLEVRKLDDGKSAYYDTETGSRWTIEGVAEEGPLKGKSLPRLDSHMSEWYGWASYFPETSIYGREDPPQPLDLLLPVTPPDKPNPPADGKSDKPDKEKEGDKPPNKSLT